VPQNYIIATTPRTGSFLLCEGLNSTGVAGNPHEYAAPEDTRSWRDYHNCTTHAEYFYRFPDLCRSANGVFGAKLMWLQFVAWGQDARRYLHTQAPALDAFRRAIGPIRVVRLLRKDRLRQAVSWVRARETGVWSVRRGEPTPAVATRQPSYDPAELARTLDRIHTQNRNWDDALASADLPVLTIYYEDLVATYSATVSEVIKFIGQPWQGNLPQPVLVQQSDDITADWIARAKIDLPDIEMK
jgi:LPS sulfotransferase NodH